MAEKKERNSNFEILRIISMFMIILAHYAGHGGIIDNAISYSGHIAGLFLKTGGKLGVICFVLISTYFMCEQKFRFEVLLRTGLQTVFYAFLIVAIVFLFGEPVGIGMIIKSFFSLFLGLYWFVTAYAGLYLFQPLLKKITDSLGEKKSATIICVMITVFSLIPFIFGNTPFLTSNLVYFSFLFFVGNHLRKFRVKIKLLSQFPLAICSACIVLIPISAIVIENILSNHPASVEKYHYVFYDLNSPLMLIAGVGLFLYFAQRKPIAKPVINRIASNMFGVYLLHDNSYFREILWHRILRIDNVYDKNMLAIIAYAVLCAILIMIVASLIEIVRRFLENIFMKSTLVKTLCDSINNKYCEV